MTAIADRAPAARTDAALTDRLFHDAHTAYAFTDEPVGDDVLSALYDLVRTAPTAVNSQPLRIVYVRTGEAKERLLPLLAEGNRAKSASAPVIAILAYDADFHEHLPRLAPHAPHLRDRFAEPARRDETARFNATLQAGYAILAARALGLDAGPMGGFDTAGVDAEFLAGTPWRAFLLLNLGHASAEGVRPRAPRLDPTDAVRWT
jgi:3-hydroxypropanoate dehydrogenase